MSRFQPAGPLRGSLRPPADKSISHRYAMLAAIAREFAGLDVEFEAPAGGMFLWLRMPEGIDTVALLPAAVERGVAFVPGLPFYAQDGDPRTLRLSFVTASVEDIDRAIAALAGVLREALAAAPADSTTAPLG